MNKEYYEGVVDKNLRYVTGIQSSDLKRGSSYKDIKKSILINFDNEWRYGEELILKFMMRSEKAKYIETENIESYHINLTEFQKIYYNKIRKLNRFEKEIVILTLNSLKMLVDISKGDKVMEEAKEKLENLTEDSVFIGLYDAELEREREYKDKMAYAEKKGLERGIEKGIEKGLEKGIEQGIEQGKQMGIQAEREKTVKKMKEQGLPLETISKITELPIEEIQGI